MLTQGRAQALGVLADAGFSTAIFAPAWTHEHFSTSSADSPSIAEKVEEAVWQGLPLPDQLGCDCRKGRPHHTVEYQLNPISRHAREFPVGTSSYVETDFQVAFERTATSQDQVCISLLITEPSLTELRAVTKYDRGLDHKLSCHMCCLSDYHQRSILSIGSLQKNLQKVSML